MPRVPEDAIFLDGKRKVLNNKNLTQLQHLLQLAQDQLRRYRDAIKNYKPKAMERYGEPYLRVLESNIGKIKHWILVRQVQPL
jgi:hypothetical protein